MIITNTNYYNRALSVLFTTGQFMTQALRLRQCANVATPSKGKGKVGRAPPERRRGAHLPFKAIEPVGG